MLCAVPGCCEVPGRGELRLSHVGREGRRGYGRGGRRLVNVTRVEQLGHAAMPSSSDVFSVRFSCSGAAENTSEAAESSREPWLCLLRRVTPDRVLTAAVRRDAADEARSLSKSAARPCAEGHISRTKK